MPSQIYARTVDQKVQLAIKAADLEPDGQGRTTAAKRKKMLHRPIQLREIEQALPLA